MTPLNKVLTITVLVFSMNCSKAAEFEIPNQFTPNTPAVAADVNENFRAVETRVVLIDEKIDDMMAAITQLQSDLAIANSTISQMEYELAVVQSNSVLSLDGYLELTTFEGENTAEFNSINVQINNGTGSTNSSLNGVGNLIVGYNEFSTFSPNICSDYQYLDETDCLANSGTWGDNFHTGSHNIVIGRGHSFTSYGGIVTSRRNAITGPYASILGGTDNIANGISSSVSGGSKNIASGLTSSVSGGTENVASGINSSVSGGDTNLASGEDSSVSGGVRNLASGQNSSVSGGDSNIASAFDASVSGGDGNQASGFNSSISGGRNNFAVGSFSVVSGGSSRTAFGTDDWVAGLLMQEN